jgi:hypothetical protein
MRLLTQHILVMFLLVGIEVEDQTTSPTALPKLFPASHSSGRLGDQSGPLDKGHDSSLRLSARLLGTGNLVAFGSWEIFPDAPPDTAYSD